MISLHHTTTQIATKQQVTVVQKYHKNTEILLTHYTMPTAHFS